MSGKTRPSQNATRPTWEKRNFTQFSVEGVYRFLPREQVFVGVRYNSMTGEPQGLKYVDLPLLSTGAKNPLDDDKTGQADVTVDRLAIAAGWFPTKNMLLKGEYVVQNFTDFPKADYRNAGKFSGFMIQAVIGF